nr:ankyrin repeat protein [Oriental turtle dovepox virus]
MRSSINNRLSVVNILEKKYIPIDSINFHPDNPLLEAVKLANTDMIKMLIDHGICINTALHLIAMNYYVPHNGCIFKMTHITNLFFLK